MQNNTYFYCTDKFVYKKILIMNILKNILANGKYKVNII